MDVSLGAELASMRRCARFRSCRQPGIRAAPAAEAQPLLAAATLPIRSMRRFSVPEHPFAFECDSEIALSGEHDGFERLRYDAAVARLARDSGKTALCELNCRLLAQ